MKLKKLRIGSILLINLLMISAYIKVMLSDADAGLFLSFFLLFIIFYNIFYGIIFHGVKLLVQLVGKSQQVTEFVFLILLWIPILYVAYLALNKLLAS